MLKWIKQPLNSRLCGQIAIAVISGISLDESIKIVGKKGGTTTKDLIKALRKLGYDCPNKCKLYPKIGCRNLSIAKLKTHIHQKKKSGWHWIVIDGFKTYDGVNGNDSGSVLWNDDWKITSYLPVTKKI